MQILDFYPSQGCFRPSQVVTLLLEMESGEHVRVNNRLYIRHLAGEPQMVHGQQALYPGVQTISFEWMPPAGPGGYAAWVELLAEDGEIAARASTAFDVLQVWTDFPRYGFLSEFSADRIDPDLTFNHLVRFHINGLQFYDWQYRHDRLLPSTDDYLDPLGRPMSLRAVRRLVDSAHRHGMAALPYLAVYAASASFWRAHPDWALYDEDQNAIPFGEDFLGLMNPSANSPWTKHLLAECARTLGSIPFDGLHIDQYGEPKRVWDAQREPVDLPRAFVDFIRAAREQHADQSILFNAVGNWPVEALSAAPLDFMYIEVWPPEVKYLDLKRLVLKAVNLSKGKPVVIALYLPEDRPANVLLANALILACGGLRIELGEQVRLLADPYFPKHQVIAPDLLSAMRKFYDFAVRNGEWLRPYHLPDIEREQWSKGSLNPEFVRVPDSIWSVVRQYDEGRVIHFVNFTGLREEARWDEAHASPTPCRDVPVCIRGPQKPKCLSWDCPEQTQGPRPLDFEYSNGELQFLLPQINYLGLLHIDE
jgi:dextranase